MKSRMDSWSTKVRLLTRLLKLWQLNPKMRLGQLLVSPWKDPSREMYALSDIEFMNELEDFYKDE